MADRDEPEVADAPSGTVQDDSYVSRSGHKNEPLPVQSDNAKVEDPIDGNVADSDAQLGMSICPPGSICNMLTQCTERDDKDAIDRSNIMDDRTRGAGKPKGTYRDPGDTEGLPDNDGRSAIASDGTKG